MYVSGGEPVPKRKAALCMFVHVDPQSPVSEI